jgi:phosphoserine phosphatase RsbU/P
MDGSRSGGNRRITLGLLIDWFKDPYQNAVFSAIARACVENDVNLLCATGGNLDPNDLFWAQRNILYEFIGPHDVDGLIVMGGNIGTFVGPQRLREYLQRYQPLKSVCIAYGLDGIPSVLVDNQVGLREVIEHLIIIHHCRRIAFIRGPAVNAEAEQRYAVYREVLAANGIPFDESLVAQGDFNRFTGLSCMQDFLSHGVKMDGLVAANDLMALGAMEVMEEAGIRVPDDVAVAGFDDEEEARLAIPQLTTVRQPIHVLAREAVRVALAQVRGQATEDVITVASQVVIRRSCGCRANSWDATELLTDSITPEANRDEVERRFHDVFATLASEGISVNERTAMALFEAVFDELDGKCVGRFATMLSDLMRPTAAGGLEPWSRVSTIIFHTLHGWTADNTERRRRSEGIAEQVLALIGDIAELAQGQQRVRLHRLLLEITEAAKSLAGAVSLDGLKRALSTHLPILHVPACTLSLYVDPKAPQQGARLEFAHDIRCPAVSSRCGESFETRHLAPSGLLFSGVRETIVIEPLFFERDQIGIMSLTMGPDEGVVYETIRDHVSGAIRGLRL